MADNGKQGDEKLRPLNELSNAQLLNLVRNEASPMYQQRIDSATQANVKETMENMMRFTATRNEFYDVLVNRIGSTYVNAWSWNDPLAIFKRNTMQYGDTLQEISVGMPTAQLYDPNQEYLGQDAFGTFKVPINSLYHKLNRQVFYPITINDAQTRQAFTSEGAGMGQLVTQLMQSQQNADQTDEFLMICSLFAEYARMGGYWRVNVPDVADMSSTQAMSQTLLRYIRAWIGNLKFPSTKYNARHMPISVNDPSELVLFTTPEVKSGLDVMGLAQLFHMEPAEVDAQIIELPAENFGMDGVQAILTTKSFLMVYDNMLENTSQRNNVSLGTNFYLHHWQTLSVSGFQPAILFWTGPATDERIVRPTGVKAATPVMQLKLGKYGDPDVVPTSAVRAERVQVWADISIANEDEASYTVKGVQYSIGTTAKTLSEFTRINNNGVLTVGMDEPNTEIPINATATYIDPAIPEVTSAVSGSYKVKITGDGVIGFDRRFVTSITILGAPDNKTAKVGDTAKLTVRGNMWGSTSADAAVDLSVLSAFESSDESVATVDSDGNVKYIAAGKVTFKATVFMKSNSTDEITVTA
jgi:hypothetical protein